MHGAISDDQIAKFESFSAVELLDHVAHQPVFGRVAMVSSFGAESGTLLHMLAQVAPATPVLMVNTGKLFGETLRYADQLAEAFALTDVRVLSAQPDRVKLDDPRNMLWRDDPERCCDVRKVRPLNDALAEFDTWISGRKRFQNSDRAGIPKVEFVDGRIKINPLADWTADDLAAYSVERGIPSHPLVADGFLSIGCYTCTDRVQPGEDPRAGRWRGKAKTECGIHVSTPASSRLPRT